MSMPGYEQAQAAYDRQEPPEEPLCWTCNNSRVVPVSAYANVDGVDYAVMDHERPVIPCMDCRYDDLKVMEMAGQLLQVLEETALRHHAGSIAETNACRLCEPVRKVIDKARGVYHAPDTEPTEST